MHKNTFDISLLLKIVLALLVCLLIIGLVNFIFAQNVQRTGLSTSEQVKAQEIDQYLDVLNKKRFTEEDKIPIREFIKAEFQKYGYQITEQKTDGYIRGMSQRQVFTSIIADKGNLSEDYILIGAHYDTVPDTTGIDDNASGVSSLLAIAKYNQNPNVRFIAFDGEEYNLSGSWYYVKNVSPLPKLMVSLETMGFYSEKPNSQALPDFYDWIYRGLYNRLKSDEFRGDFSAAVCTNNASDFCEEYESFASGLNLKAYSVYIPDLYLLRNLFIDLFRSDHAPFLIEGIPAVMITDTANFRTPNYHQPSDTRETVDSQFIAKQANALLGVISNDN